MAMGRKASDEFVVPLCRQHHDEVHRRGVEAAWWAEWNIDPVPIALALWRASQEGTAPADSTPASDAPRRTTADPAIER